MNILLTNHSLDFRAGSETWVLTILSHLSKNHNVDIFTTLKNTLTSSSFNRNKHYDLALINHNSCLTGISRWDINVRIFTSHGIIPNLEKPISGADAYVAVSEEVQEHIKRIGFDSHVIRNPIDTDYFSYSPVHKTLQNILYLNNRRANKALVKATCIPWSLHIMSGQNIDPLHAILWSDLVITAGRGCYESLSCGKNVIVLNRGLSDGIVTRENIKDLRKNNCSGRNRALTYSTEDLAAELTKYDPTRNLRPYILENNNVALISNKYLSLYESIRAIH